MLRSINKIIKAEKVNMGGIMIDQPLPHSQLQQKDPFLLIHHWSSILQGGQRQKEVGVGPHPHRGFSPVTLVFKGALHHRDSLGNDSIVHSGGVQWMNAGKGITHSERPSKELAENGGEFEIIQFWINSPKKFKMDSAEYHPKNKEDIPTVILNDGITELQLISGQYNNVEGPISGKSELLIARIDSSIDSNFFLDLNPNFHTLIYQLNGLSSINNKDVSEKTLVVFENEKGKINIKSKDDSRLLVLSGLPIEEPITQYGPFVMNNTTEIMEAIRDAQIGKMGVLIEEFN